MTQKPGTCGYIGCVGDDNNGRILKEATEKSGASTHYYVTKEAPTGTCAVCVVDKER
jgi:adenosine kinase